MQRKRQKDFQTRGNDRHTGEQRQSLDGSGAETPTQEQKERSETESKTLPGDERRIEF